MRNLETPAERRASDRYAVIEGTFAALRDDNGSVGQVVDIGRGGLALKYIDQRGWAIDFQVIDIVLCNSGIVIKGVPVRPVSDVKGNMGIPFSQLPIRRLGFQFGELSEEQLDQLEYLLRHHTVTKDH